MIRFLSCFCFLTLARSVRSDDASENKPCVLDIIGDNDIGKIDVNTSDPNVTKYIPINDADVVKVVYGDKVLWKKRRSTRFVKLLVFKVQKEIKFLHLYFNLRKKQMSTVIVKNGEKWQTTGTYRVKEDTPIENESPGPSESEEEKPSKEVDTEVDLELSGDPSKVAAVREYISLQIPTTEIRPYVDKKITRITDRFQTITKNDFKKGAIRLILWFSKKGYDQLLHVGSGISILGGKSRHFEYSQNRWKEIPFTRFLTKLNYAAFNDKDPFYDQPVENFVNNSSDFMDPLQYYHNSLPGPPIEEKQEPPVNPYPEESSDEANITKPVEEPDITALGEKSPIQETLEDTLTSTVRPFNDYKLPYSQASSSLQPVNERSADSLQSNRSSEASLSDLSPLDSMFDPLLPHSQNLSLIA